MPDYDRRMRYMAPRFTGCWALIIVGGALIFAGTKDDVLAVTVVGALALVLGIGLTITVFKRLGRPPLR